METIEQRLEEWSRDLLDLSFRNRLLSLPRVVPGARRQSVLQLDQPKAADIYNMLVEERTVCLVSPPDPEEDESADRDARGQNKLFSDVSPDKDSCTAAPLADVLPPDSARTIQAKTIANRVALRLLRQARVSIQEQGINVLFAAFGVLKWNDSKEQRPRYSPLLLLPIQISEDAHGDRFCIERLDDAAEFNLTLAERIRNDYGLQLQLDEPESETGEVDYEAIVTHVRKQIAPRQDWEVLDEVYLGLFQFHKLRMVKDLREHSSIAANHEIVQALAIEDASIAPPPDQIPGDDELDRKVAPEETFSVLDADASQRAAIEAVKRGGHVTIQGPPGTGKSQTIANVIAESIAQGKKVLFVSEKSAALEVVRRRLEQVGLGDFCLALHSHKANKAEIIDELYRRMEPSTYETKRDSENSMLSSLMLLRQRLNAYPEALHKDRSPFGSSVFKAFQELAKLENVPDFPSMVMHDLTNLTDEGLGNWQDTLSRLAYHHVTLQDEKNEIWTGLKDRALSPNEQARLLNLLVTTERLLEEVEELVSSVSPISGLAVPTTMGECRELAGRLTQVPVEQTVRASWIDRVEVDRILKSLHEVVDKVQTVQPQANQLFEHFTDELVNLPHSELLASYDRNFLYRLFSSEHRAHRERVRSASRPGGATLSPEEEAAALRTAAALRQDLDWFQSRNPQLVHDTGKGIESLLSLTASLWDDDIAVLKSMRSFLSGFGEDGIPQPLRETLQNQAALSTLLLQTRELSEALQRIDALVEEISTFQFAGSWVVDGSPWDNVAFASLRSWLRSRIDRFKDLNDWIRARLALKDAEETGLSGAIAEFSRNGLDPEDWPRAFRKRVLEAWISGVQTDDPALRDFYGEEHERRIEAFQRAD